MALILALTGCAGRRLEGDGYRSPKGYRVSLPGPGWQRVSDSRADLELRHGNAAAILVNASCDSRLAGRPLEALGRELLAGFSGREVQARDTAVVAGRESAHLVVEGHEGRQGERVRLELFVLRGDGCVYDLLYAAPPAEFPRWRGDFQRLVGTFTLE
jgi:hypothetical protein